MVRDAPEAICAARSGDTAWAEERSALAAANDDDMTRNAAPSALIGPLPYAECGHRDADLSTDLHHRNGRPRRRANGEGLQRARFAILRRTRPSPPLGGTIGTAALRKYES